MKKLIYTLLGEGIAEDAFIPAYIQSVAKVKNIQTVRSRLKISTSSKPSMSKVLDHLESFCIQSLVQNNEQLFIAGIDLDKPDHTDKQELYKARIQELKNKLGTLYGKYENKIILFVPVQCIDHWLYYQYYKIDKSEKPSNNSLESQSGKEIKKMLYGNRRDGGQIKEITAKIIKDCDFDELAKQSRSFRNFHEKVTKFIDQLLKDKAI